MQRDTQIAALAAAAIFASSIPSAAQDKTGYTIFNPTPRELMRELSADRPDATESPVTVDAGHYQLEVSAFDFIRNSWSDSDGKTSTRTFGAAALKAGFLHNVDFHLVFDSYVVESTESKETGETRTIDGFGDTLIRLKANLWGNEGGTTALALMPFVKAPTAEGELGNDEVEGGLIVPAALEVGGGWGAGAMAEFDAVYDAEDDDHELEFVHSAVIGREVLGPLGWYGEYIGIVSSDPGQDYRAFFGTGLTLGLGEDVQLDAGVNAGLNRAADDVNVFRGLTYRL